MSYWLFGDRAGTARIFPEDAGLHCSGIGLASAAKLDDVYKAASKRSWLAKGVIASLIMILQTLSL